MKVLRHGKEWVFGHILSNLPYQLAPTLARKLNRYAVNNFHAFAKKNKSSAIWLSKTGFLVTEDDNELTKRYPYENWLQQAIWIGINELKKCKEGIKINRSAGQEKN